MEGDVGQRLAALRFEVEACTALQVEYLNEAERFLEGLREEREALDELISFWSRCLSGGVG